MQLISFLVSGPQMRVTRQEYDDVSTVKKSQPFAQQHEGPYTDSCFLQEQNYFHSQMTQWVGVSKCPLTGNLWLRTRAA